MADFDDDTKRALLEHYITEEMFASHVVIYMPSFAGKN